MMKRIKYMSRSSSPLSAEAIRRLGSSAARKNADLGVTGVLMTSGGVFFQILEGPAEAVDGLWAAIARDKRHTDVLLLSSEERVKSRLFPDWAMAAIDLDAENARLEPLKAVLGAVWDAMAGADRR